MIKRNASLDFSISAKATLRSDSEASCRKSAGRKSGTGSASGANRLPQWEQYLASGVAAADEHDWQTIAPTERKQDQTQSPRNEFGRNESAAGDSMKRQMKIRARNRPRCNHFRWEQGDYCAAPETRPRFGGRPSTKVYRLAGAPSISAAQRSDRHCGSLFHVRGDDHWPLPLRHGERSQSFGGDVGESDRLPLPIRPQD